MRDRSRKTSSWRRRAAAGLALWGLAAGCATISSGPNQAIPIESFPPGATVKVDGITATTPCEVRLSRRHDHQIVLQKPGYKTARVDLTRATNESAADGNAFWFGLTGLAVDLITGAYFELHPTHVVVSLQEEKATPDSGTASAPGGGKPAAGGPSSPPASAPSPPPPH